MENNNKRNGIGRLQHWMDGECGQTFLNYAYSWGAAIVILGALFKLTHLPAADLFLYIGMGTEVLVFFVSAFDRPFVKTTKESFASQGEEQMRLSEQLVKELAKNGVPQEVVSELETAYHSLLDHTREAATAMADLGGHLKDANTMCSTVKHALGSMK